MKSPSTFELLTAVRKAKQQRVRRDAVILKILWKCLRIMNRVAKSPVGQLIAIAASLCPIALAVWFCLWWNANDYIGGIATAIAATLVVIVFGIFWPTIQAIVRELIVLVEDDSLKNSEEPFRFGKQKY